MRQDPVMRRLLIDDGTGQPGKIPERERQHWFFDTRRDLGKQWTNFEHWVLGLWAQERNKLGRLRDSGPRYAQYQQNISFLLNGMPQSVTWP